MPRLITLLISLMFAFPTAAVVISNSGEEVDYEFQVEVRTQQTKKLNPTETLYEAHQHANHVFGIFQSNDYVEQFGLQPEMSEGFAGTKYPNILESGSYKVEGDERIWVRYKARGRTLVLKPIVQSWLKNKNEATIRLPMLTDLTKVYSDADPEVYANKKWKKCTDEHYDTPADFYYFGNPFRCPELGRAPVGRSVEFKITRVDNSKGENLQVPIKELHTDNGNGRLVTLYFANGFYEQPSATASDSTLGKDDGWKLYKSIDAYLTKKLGFTKMESLDHLRKTLGKDFSKISLLAPVTMSHDKQRRYFGTFVRIDKDVTYVVRSGLFNTDNEEKSQPLLTFPKFWKEAWENGDFVYYGGHSGSGRNLNLDTMLTTLKVADLKAIRFKKQKHQIAFIDACSSYAYFQDLYSGQKPQNLHLATFGLVSLFHMAKESVQGMMDIITSDRQWKWSEALADIEQRHLEPHVRFLWEPEDVDKIYKQLKKSGDHPSMLLNVWAPN